MLTLNDGRSELWQWDTGRTVSVDADCSQVHFSNKVFGRSIDIDVVDGVADIPDILLQTDRDLIAWAFVGTAENGYTKISKVFKVNKRNKPADYVFTPPEQTTLEEIKEKIEYLESIQDPDAIKNAVDDYLANNPIKVEEKDPTVPEWAKQPTPPDVKIPDKLPNPHSITFTGAVNASYDGSDPVEITIPGSGGNVAYDEEQNLTDEQKAQARDNIGAQPKGDYLTEVPEGYAKTEDIPTDEHIIDLIEENVPESSGCGIAVTGATVGQTVKISAVDEKGVPTAWEPTDFPSGGGDVWEEIRRVTVAEDVNRCSITENVDGQPFNLKKATIFMRLRGNTSGATSWINLSAGGATISSFPNGFEAVEGTDKYYSILIDVEVTEVEARINGYRSDNNTSTKDQLRTNMWTVSTIGSSIKPGESIDKIEVKSNGAGIGANTEIFIYGVRA